VAPSSSHKVGPTTDQRRLEAYTDYGYAVKNLIHLALRVSAHRGLNDIRPALAPDEGLELLEAANQERAVKWKTVLLLGTPDTVAAARDWHTNAWNLEHFALARISDNVGTSRRDNAFWNLSR
jgi:hypothetical protein